MSLTRNFIYKSLLNFFSIILPIIIMPYVYRVLNPESIGLYEYGFSIVSYFSAFGLFGFYIYGLKQISVSRDIPEKVNRIYNNLFFLGIITNTSAFIIYIIYIFIAIEDISLKNIMLILSFKMISNLFYTEWINEAFESFKFISIKSIVIRFISIILIFSFVKDPSDIYIYGGITVLSLFFNNIASFIYSSRHFKISFKNIEIKEHLSPLFFIFLLSNSFLLYGNFDRVILGLNVGKDDVAYYSVAQKVVSVAYTLLMGLTAVSYPRLANLLEKDNVAYRNTLKSIINHTMFLLIPASIGLLLLSDELIVLFAGEQYILASGALKVGAIYIIVMAFVSVMNYHVLIAHGKERICTYLFILFGVVNIVTDYSIGKNLSASIAFATTVAVQVLLFLSMLYYAKRKYNIFSELINKQNLRYLLSSLIFIPIVYITRQFTNNCITILGVSIIFCIVIYLIIMKLMKDSVFVSLLKKFKNRF